MPAPAPAAPGSAPAAEWEIEAGSSVIHNDTAWLLSFIDILTLLLTLFVLLLAYEHNEQSVDELSLQSAQQRVTASAVLVPMIETLETAYPLAIPLTISDWFTLLDPRTMSRADSIEELTGAATATVLPPVAEADVVEQLPASPGVQPELDTPAAGNGVIAPLAVATAVEQTATSSLLSEDESPAMSPLPAPQSNMADAVAALVPGSVQRHETAAANALLQDISGALRDRIEVSVATGVVNLEISDNILFRLANASLTEAGYAALDELAVVLKDQPYVLSVEGHTDNVPIQTALFPTNWELSSARAAIVTRSLIERGIAADRIRAIGYGDTRPRADNLSTEGRARNRRVSFVLHVE